MKRLMLAAVVSVALAGNASAGPVERTWKAKCSGCHGMDGKGATEKGKKMKLADMSSAEFQKGKDEEWKKAINDGVKKDGKEMDPFKEELKPEQVDELVKFIRGFAAK